MKDLKVKDLDPVLRNVIDSQISRYPKMDEMDAEYYFQFVDWKNCSNEERLKYADLMYEKLPIGSVIKDAWDGEIYTTVVSPNKFHVEFEKNKRTDVLLKTDMYYDICVYEPETNKWAEIISRPDEKEETKPLFKVGDRPEWTEELIKQLPHGAKIACATCHGDVDFYIGQKVIKTRENSIYFETVKHLIYFYSYRTKEYAQILSLPEETKEPFRIDFSDNCTQEQRVDIEKMLKECYSKTSTAGSILMNGEPEFQPGEMVDHKFVNSNWLSKGALYTGGINSKGNPIVELCGNLYVVKEIRKIQPDPEKKFSDKVDEIINKRLKQAKGFYNSTDTEHVKAMLIEALKTEVR